MSNVDSAAGGIGREGLTLQMSAQYQTVEVIGSLSPSVFSLQKALSKFRKFKLFIIIT